MYICVYIYIYTYTYVYTDRCANKRFPRKLRIDELPECFLVPLSG